MIKTRSQWKTQHFETREYIEKKQALYLARDDLYLKNIGSQITKIDTESDEKATKEEISFVSLTSKDGMTVRRDAIHALKTRKRIKHEASVEIPNNSFSNNNNNPEIGKEFKSLTSDKIEHDNQRKNSEPVTIIPTSLSIQDVEFSKADNDPFWGSFVELCSEDRNNGARGVHLANAIASHLKPHQVEGIKFMWRNTCSDLPMIHTQEERLLEKDVGGCILAHMMGLGKLTFEKRLDINSTHLSNHCSEKLR